MSYMLSKLNDEQLKELLNCMQTAILIEPIRQAPNFFKNLPKGFRITKLTLNQLVKIYVEEIKKDCDGRLGKYISKYIQQKFDDIGITELFDSTLNETSLVNVIEKIIIENKVLIPSYLILALKGINTDNEKVLVAKEVHLMLMEENQRGYSLGKDDGIKESKKVFENIVLSERRHAEHAEKEAQKYKKIIEDLQEKILSEKNENTKIKKGKVEAEKKAKQSDAENLILKINSKADKENVENCKMKVSAMENEISRYTVDKENLSTELLAIKSECVKIKCELSNEKLCVKQLRENLLQLESRHFSDKIIKELTSDVILDIQGENIGKEEIIKYAHIVFDQDLKIAEAWENLSLKNNELLSEIINKMEKDCIIGDDISILDEIENGIYVKFLVLKSLKVLFYKILEIKEIDKSIGQGFIKNTQQEIEV